MNEIFRQTQDHFDIKNKDLAEAVGISAKHISYFRWGRGDMSVKLLWRLIQAMDEMAPGARQYFGDLVCDRQPLIVESQPNFEGMSNKELGKWMFEIGDEMAKRLEDTSRQNAIALAAQ
jgi:hypothetical protein